MSDRAAMAGTASATTNWRGPLAMGVTVFLLSFVCLAFTRELGQVAAVWPVNAVVLAMLLHTPTSRWSLHLAFALTANVAADVLAGGDPLVSVGLSACNVAEAALAAALVRRLAGNRTTLRGRQAVRGLLLAGGFAPAVSALGAAAVLAFSSRDPFWKDVLEWYVPDALGLITVTPALLAVTPASLSQLGARLRRGDGLLAVAVLAAALAAAFSQQHFSLLFLVPSALILVAFQLEMAGAAMALLVAAFVAVAATLTGHGPAMMFTGSAGMRLAYLQIFLATLTLSVLPVAAALARQASYRQRLKSALDESRGAGAALVEAQRMSRMAKQLAGVGYWRMEMTDPPRHVWSETMYRIHGVERADFEGRLADAQHLYDAESQVRLGECIRRSLATGEPFDLTIHLRRGDDARRRTIVFRGEVERTEAGEPVAVFGVMRDVTDEEQAAIQLRKSEAQFRQLADAAADVIVRVGRDRTVEFVSAGIARYGYAPEDLLGRSPLGLIHPEEHAKVAAMQASLLSTGEYDGDTTYRIRQAEGEYIWIESRPAVVRDEHGEVTAIISQIRNVSEQRAAATALAESEAHFRLLANSATDILLQLRPDNVVIYASPSVRRYGWEPEQLVGTNCGQYIHPDDVPGVADRLLRVARNLPIDPSTEPMYRIRKADGDYAWVEGSPTGVFDSSGAVQSIVCQLRDVTQRHAAMEALAESEARYRLLANNINDVIACYGRDGTLTFLSPAVESMLGYPPEELLGRSIVSLMHPDDVVACDALFKAHIAQGPTAKPFRCEYRLRRKSGEMAWLEANPHAVYHPDTGAFVQWQDVVRDITARKAVDAALAESEARYRLITEKAGDIISRFSPDGAFIYLSPSVEEVTGYSPDELEGKAWLPHVHPDDRENLVETYRDIALGVKPDGVQIRYRARHRDGHWIWLEAKPTVVRDPSGQVAEYIDVTREVGAQVEMEAELRAARDEARSAAAVKADFMANMSHEIRTPLTAIIGFTTLLDADPTLSEAGRGWVGRVASAGQALLTIVNDVLDFSKLEAGLFEIKPEPCSPSEVLRDSLLMFQPQADAKGLELRLSLSAALPSAVLVDRHRLRQVLTNLIGNALKFTDTGHVTLRAAFDPLTGRLSVMVEDSGAGMDEAQLARLFRRYSQVDASAAKSAGGTGLGLAICRGLVEAMGGAISVRSAPGEGSAFSFEIDAPQVEMAQPGPGDGPGVSLEGARLLVADDNPTNRELVRALLEPLGLNIIEAEDGQRAYDEAAAMPFDLILLDVRMPGLSGPEVAARLRRSPGPNKDVPILAFTADVDLAEPAGGSPFDGIVAKPISPQDLIGAIVQHLSWMAATSPRGGEAQASG